MKLKKIITLILSAVLSFSALPVLAEENTEPVKYEKNLYYIGEGIPAESYILITKDVTKPSYVGVYTNQKGVNAKFETSKTLIYGTSEDYIYPHYFENNKFYSADDISVPNNQGNCLLSSYFEYSSYIDLYQYKYNNTRKDFLYLENCYAIPTNDINKTNLDFNKDGFMPSEGFITNEETYQIEVNENERVGYFACYEYDKFRKQLRPLTRRVIINKQYFSGKTEYIIDNTLVTIPKETDVILKIGININDIGGNPIYTHKGITYPDNFTEKYNFNDVNPTLKDIAVKSFKALREKEIAIKKSDDAFIKSSTQLSVDRRNIFKSFNGFAKTPADYEYIKYIREIYTMYSQSNYIDNMINKYLYNATCFEDLSKILRLVAYNDYRSDFYEYTTYNLRICTLERFYGIYEATHEE